ncbi:Maltose transport system permease protein MalF [Bythopirellula polymerisocia]|uniref:Maltose transport system permease protein MalF n=1 Tax=Bythopirellula polymerisocia TaxID=2528003 RepID=A0A5C6CVS4_9BACT|nr:Maltose transport system permease protein MalF [Bythopirellula polymerisocia]
MGSQSRGRQSIWTLFALGCLFLLGGCSQNDPRRSVTLWHQMVPRDRVMLDKLVEEFEAAHPEIDVRTLYKETEELRSGFQTAALAGIGPELVYGPSDVLGTFHAMGIVGDMSPWVNSEEAGEFVEGALTYLPDPNDSEHRMLLQVPDRFGNHLALVYNRKFIAEPPATTAEMVDLAVANTLDTDRDGRQDRYGLVWNFVEPFFAIPFLTGYGAWVFDESGQPVPALDSPESVSAYQFILSLQQEHGVVPRNCDYETADSLFKSGKAAMIINGDWSWTDYLETEGIDAAIAPLPVVSATGKPMAPMISPKGYSLNALVSPQAAEDAMQFVQFMTSAESQRKFMELVRILPSRKKLLDDPLIREDPTLAASKEQFDRGRIMPVDIEMRAVWDAMRPPYQTLLGGNTTPAAAARQMQQNALHSIEIIQQESAGTAFLWLWQLAGLAICGSLVFWQRESLLGLLPDMRRQPFAYLLIAPALIVMFATVVFPFFYNVLLSLSNMSLHNFQEWSIVGLRNYLDVFTEAKFFGVLLKTLVWTVVNVVFHVGIGVALAIALNGPIRGKPLYRVLLIIPWAVPAYITALTWRSMFHYDYGAVNLLLGEFLGIPPLNWLGEPGLAFTACIVANVWLGYPFMMVIALGGLQGIPQELYEAARIDGANRWQQFRNVTLPLLKPVLAPAVVLGGIWTFNNLNVIWLVSNGGEPADQTHILVSYVYKAVFSFYRYGYGAALSMVIFVLLLAVSLYSLHRTRATESVYT